jgi:hypothetical protein
VAILSGPDTFFRGMTLADYIAVKVVTLAIINFHLKEELPNILLTCVSL